MKSTITLQVRYFVTMLAVLIVSVFTIPSFAHANYGGYGYYGFDPISVSEMYPSSASYQSPVYTSYPTPVSTPVYYPVYYPTYYATPVYNHPQYAPLIVSCRSDYTYTNIGSNVLWIAYASGGSGSYIYTWSGTEGISGSSRSIYKSYITPGQKTAAITVRSTDGQVVTQTCSTAVTVAGPYYTQPMPVPVPQYPVYTYPTQAPMVRNLDIGCYVDPTKASINQPVTWNAEVSGGFAPYTYSWTGSDGLSGNQASVIKYYSTSGEKSAIVSVTSADGKTGTRACSNAITVKKAATVTYVKPQPKPKTPPVYEQPTETPREVGDKSDDQQASSFSSLFSLSNVPWGWVAILVILILFFTVVYLLFNRQKI